MRPDTVAAAVADDRAAGRRPFCLVATSGTTSTGSVDPLADLANLAALCRAEGLWFHVDGAFGAPAVLSTGGRELLAGLDAAAGDREVDFTDRGLQLTRGFRAFKLWLSLKVFGLEAVNHRVADAMLVDELATLSSALLGGRTTLRLCTVNPRTTREDVEATLARVEELAAAV